eukprot:CAMPEP_0178983226 /NCGR_PEP_ID=MMETSP0795-20121207/936_1 /TAXON_ID=88552 /ORGANISM="Amoebophrya sp., Strain Ameob2" /LENGTH=195 /DNA_ID=CAMNT_0020673963 /DNA_START=673 /DNA_END=1256 /DNA_ORIENTATION=+
MTFGVMPGTSTLACSQSLSDRSGRITMRPSAERLGTTPAVAEASRPFRFTHLLRFGALFLEPAPLMVFFVALFGCGSFCMPPAGSASVFGVVVSGAAASPRARFAFRFSRYRFARAACCSSCSAVLPSTAVAPCSAPALPFFLLVFCAARACRRLRCLAAACSRFLALMVARLTTFIALAAVVVFVSALLAVCAG